MDKNTYRNTYSKGQAAKIVGVSASRVSQLVRELELTPKRGSRGAFEFEWADIKAMMGRNKTPGPKPNGAK